MSVEPTARPAPPPRRLKKRVLRGAVADNLRAIRNQPPGDLRRRRPLPWALFGAAAAVALAGGALWFALSLPGPPASAAAQAERAVPDAAAAPGNGSPARVSGQVFPVAVRRIVVDPGHGGSDFGTRTPSGVPEKVLTLDIAQRLNRRLLAAGFEPLLTRERDERLLLSERARIANERRADLFVSIHLNWFQDGRANRGIETYYLGPTDDPFLTELASLENRESGYAIADVRRLLDSIYADLRQEQSKALATAVQRRLVRSVRELSSEVRDRGVKSAPFLVLVATGMPAILAEVASLSNQDEARLLDQEAYRERIAIALCDGIRAYSRSVARTAHQTEAR
jgi:N-acetylmuramoyl-L-alanine amidase